MGKIQSLCTNIEYTKNTDRMLMLFMLLERVARNALSLQPMELKESTSRGISFLFYSSYYNDVSVKVGPSMGEGCVSLPDNTSDVDSDDHDSGIESAEDINIDEEYTSEPSSSIFWQKINDFNKESMQAQQATKTCWFQKSIPTRFTQMTKIW